MFDSWFFDKSIKVNNKVTGSNNNFLRKVDIPLIIGIWAKIKDLTEEKLYQVIGQLNERKIIPSTFFF